MTAWNLIVLSLSASLLVTPACSSSSSPGGTGTAGASCKNPTALSTACNSCNASMCPSEVASVESECSGYVSCYDDCDCSNTTCIGACVAAASASCKTVLEAASTSCPACNDACGISSSSPGMEAGAGVDCFKKIAIGTEETCDFLTNEPSCNAGLGVGHCPTTGAVGCCVAPLQESTGAATGGTCYYDATGATAGKLGCKSAGSVWTTTVP